MIVNMAIQEEPYFDDFLEEVYGRGTEVVSKERVLEQEPGIVKCRPRPIDSEKFLCEMVIDDAPTERMEYDDILLIGKMYHRLSSAVRGVSRNTSDVWFKGGGTVTEGKTVEFSTFEDEAVCYNLKTRTPLTGPEVKEILYCRV